MKLITNDAPQPSGVSLVSRWYAVRYTGGTVVPSADGRTLYEVKYNGWAGPVVKVVEQ